MENFNEQSTGYLKELFWHMNNSSKFGELTEEEKVLSNMLKLELNDRGYAIIPGTCIPQIKLRCLCTEEELKYEW